MLLKNLKKNKITVLGLGYVGLPLAVALSKYFDVSGYDLSLSKINNLKKGKDDTNQIDAKNLKNKNLSFSTNSNVIQKSNLIIVAVPTPVDKKNLPDISLLKKACKTIGLNLKKRSVVVFESTVYPGLTEEICVKILEKSSKLKWKKDFNVGYSPERINPGDKKNDLRNITKIISADNPKTLNYLQSVYKKIIKKTYLAPSIKVAEAAKIIENTQRDINIAFMNELSLIFSRLKINIYDVLKAAETKWNFIKFEPGLVGGHCIGVDPYYLTYKARKTGYNPRIITSGRKLNDDMTKYVYKKFNNLVKEKINTKSKIKTLLLGITFKENCNDFRNSKNIELYRLLTNDDKFSIDVYDPVVDKVSLYKEFKIKSVNKPKLNNYDAILLLVKHKEFINMDYKILSKYGKKNFIVLDIKNIFFKKYFKKGNIFSL